jgi:hypothetical protein
MEKDSGNLRMLVSLWDEGGGYLGNPFIGDPRGGRSAKYGG